MISSISKLTNCNGKELNNFRYGTCITDITEYSIAFPVLQRKKQNPLQSQWSNIRMSVNCTNNESSYWRCSIKEAVLRIFAIFTGKHLYWSLLLKKFLKRYSKTGFSCEYYEIFNNTYFGEHLQMASSRIVLSRKNRQPRRLHSFFIRTSPVDTRRKLNVDKTFRRCLGRLLNVLCTFNLRIVPTGKTFEFRLNGLLEAVTQTCFVKKVFLEKFSKIHRKTPVPESPATLLKKRLWHRCFHWILRNL